jgi:TolB-like protein
MSDGRSRSTTGASRFGLSLWLALGAIGALCGAVPAAAEATPKLLLLPVLVHSAEDPTYLREGLDDMLTARLERIGALALIEPDPNMKGTTQLARAREMGRRLGADYVLFGSFTRFGQGASLDVQCAPTGANRGQAPLREIFVHSGSIGDIIPDLDELAGKVSRFAHGEVVPATPEAARSGVAVSARDYQSLLGRVTALEKSLADLKERPKTKGE